VADPIGHRPLKDRRGALRLSAVRRPPWWHVSSRTRGLSLSPHSPITSPTFLPTGVAPWEPHIDDLALRSGSFHARQRLMLVKRC
jgi:hypothetical protein